MDLLLALVLLWLVFGLGAVARGGERPIKAVRSPRVQALLRCPEGRVALRRWMVSRAPRAVIRYRNNRGELTSVTLHRAVPPLLAAAQDADRQRATDA